MIHEEHGFLSLQDRAIHVSLCQPQTLQPSAPLVVICEPLGEEKRPAYRMMVRLARRLAEERGMPSIRVDISGYGDSEKAHGAATWNDWREEISAACAALQTRFKTQPPRKIIAIGARAGALLAAAVARDMATETAAFIAVEPIVSGDDFIRELERRESIKSVLQAETTGTADGNDTQDNENQTRSFAGLEYNATLLRELANIRLADLLQDAPFDVHAIRVSPSSKIPASWPFAPSSVTHVVDKPFWGQLEYYESDRVIQTILELMTA